jgi:hypothetical protein
MFLHRAYYEQISVNVPDAIQAERQPPIEHTLLIQLPNFELLVSNPR